MIRRLAVAIVITVAVVATGGALSGPATPAGSLDRPAAGEAAADQADASSGVNTSPDGSPLASRPPEADDAPSNQPTGGAFEDLRLPADLTPGPATSGESAPAPSATTTTVAPPPSTTTTTTTIPPPLVPPPSTSWYGTGLKGNGIRPRAATVTEWAVGPITAPRSSTIETLGLYFIFAVEGSYFSGTGGINRFTIKPDVGGQPGSQVLGELTIANPMSPDGIWSDWASREGNWSQHTLATPAPVSGGSRYWIVAENLHQDPANNWVGINALTAGGGAPGTAYVHLETSSSSNTFTTFQYPGEGRLVGLFDLQFGDGSGFGQGYLHGHFHQVVGDDRRAREFITPSARHTVTSLRVWAPRTGGDGALTATLQNGNSVVAEASVVGSGWVAFPIEATLEPGTTYTIEFSAPAGTTYSFAALRETSNWTLGSRFTDGFADYYQHGAWLGGWPIWGLARQDGDLMFYFTE